MGNAPSRSGARWLTAGIAFFVLSVYSFPYLATTVALKSKQVPFSFAADLSLYLNLSKTGSSGVNPYFGTMNRSGGISYTTFDTAFRLLGLFVRAANNDLWCGVLIWNLFWWTAMFASVVWFLRVAFPEESKLNLCLAMSLLFFFNFGVVKSLVLAWLHVPSLRGFDELALPDIRAVFPQVAIPLLLVYLALQVRALSSWRWYDWTGMCLLQAAAFTTFPYTTLIMAVTTLVGVLGGLGQKPLKRLRTVVAYGAACALIDSAFLLFHLSGGVHDPRQSLISFHPSRAIGLAGGAWLLLMLLTLATATSPSAGSLHAKWTMVGMGFANSLLILADTTFSPALQVSVHGGYFVHSTISLQIVYLVQAAFARFGHESGWLRAACLAGIMFATTTGLILAFAGYRYSLAENKDTNELAIALRSGNITKDDLVIARGESVDDLCSWVPLLTPSRVLFCRSAQYELSSEQKRSLYRSRQAFYLYFMGRTSGEIEQVANDSRDIGEQDRLAFAGEINTADKEQWDRGRTAIRTD